MTDKELADLITGYYHANKNPNGFMEVGDYTVRYSDDKLVNNEAAVAVMVSTGYGIGWSTYHRGLINPMDWYLAAAALVIQEEVICEAESVTIGVYEEIIKNWWENKFPARPMPDICVDGFEQCFVEWVHEGSNFYLTNHDGYETLKFIHYDHTIYEA